MPKRKPVQNSRLARASELASRLRLVVGKVKRRLRDRGRLGELTVSQMSVLGRLEREGPATVAMLARSDGMRPQSMGANVAALEAAGFVCGTPDPSDGRQTIWSLTAAFRKWIVARRAAREDWLAHAVATQLAPDEQKELARALTLLERIADFE